MDQIMINMKKFDIEQDLTEYIEYSIFELDHAEEDDLYTTALGNLEDMDDEIRPLLEKMFKLGLQIGKESKND